MSFRLIALDLDGTLLDPQHRISSANAAAVAACVAGGARVLIATGRTFTSARPYIADLRLVGPQITLNGAVFADLDGNQMMMRQYVWRGRAERGDGRCPRSGEISRQRHYRDLRRRWGCPGSATPCASQTTK